jgi:hypothetical protein
MFYHKNSDRTKKENFIMNKHILRFLLFFCAGFASYAQPLLANQSQGSCVWVFSTTQCRGKSTKPRLAKVRLTTSAQIVNQSRKTARGHPSLGLLIHHPEGEANHWASYARERCTHNPPQAIEHFAQTMRALPRTFG